MTKLIYTNSTTTHIRTKGFVLATSLIMLTILTLVCASMFTQALSSQQQNRAFLAQLKTEHIQQAFALKITKMINARVSNEQIQSEEPGFINHASVLNPEPYTKVVSQVTEQGTYQGSFLVIYLGEASNPTGITKHLFEIQLTTVYRQQTYHQRTFNAVPKATESSP
ncbi:hypothetical protein [Thalassotalea sp. PS06]|uniref:hypothetical protein n=1 Tax=Thalassotalea sp. PS06 TaxID=2594005 RepID=UPI00116556B9|nr:hypothetical protein [Thalassotalea sp. PS06]QDP02042.1 hypothetical protein FNC98_12260 [Thalassotalea sp. PS06]